LLKASEDFTSSLDWLKKPDTDAPTITGGVTDPNGGTDAQRVNFTANRQSRVQQSVTLSASTQYTFSVYARVNTGTDQFRLRNITLGEAEAKTATTSWTRFEYTFTTTTGGVYELSIQNTENVAANIEFFGAMLNVGSSANDYVKVDPSTGGSAPTPAYSGFGDVFGGATAYYSLRKFTEAETLNAIRVRRSSDDTEQDIGFDSNGDLDTTALLAFVGTGGTDNGFVSRWYDQTGNGNDATNATASEQPLIVSGGTLVEENGKAAILPDGVDDELQMSAQTLKSVFVVDEPETAQNGVLGGYLATMTTKLVYRTNASLENTFSGTITDQALFSVFAEGASDPRSINAFRNGTAATNNPRSLNLNTNSGHLLSRGGGGYYSKKVQEIIIFDSDQKANRTGMETNINDHFDIYTP